MAAKKPVVKKPAPRRKRKPKEIEPVKFVPVERAFKPQVKVRALHDLNGWVDRRRRIKWHIGTGQIGCIDEDKAREWMAKGYAELIEGTVKPVSEDEAAEFLSTMTRIGIGGNNG